jgi:DNA-binding GntR family transcriptional regulator
MIGTDLPKTAKDIALREIVNLVISHKYKPGDRFFETSLADELNMSRTPVREALTNLISTGFLEKIDKQKGYQIPVLTAEDMEKVFHARVLLEGDTAFRAAKNITDEAIENLRELNEIERIAFYNSNRSDYSDANERIHMMLASLANNAYITRYTKELFWRSNLYSFFFTSFYTFGPSENMNITARLSYEEHRLIIDALSERDCEKSASLTRMHIENTYRSIIPRRNDLQI